MRRRASRPVILVVDDEADVRHTLQLILGDDYDVLEAADAEAATAIAAMAPIDLLLVDILMPRTDGLQLLQQVSSVRPGVPAVVVSALDHAATAAAALRLGAVDYVTKPFDEQLLLGVVRCALRERTLDRSPSGARPIILVFSASAGLVAGLTASLRRLLDIHSYVELPPDPGLLSVGRPAGLILDLREHQRDSLSRVARLLDRFYPVPVIALVRDKDTTELSFALSGDHIVLTQPVRFTEILDAVYRLTPDAKIDRRWSDDRVAAVIDAVFSDPAGFELGSVGQRFGASPRSLSRAFGKALGCSIGKYVATVRVHNAAFLLQHTGVKIEEVAGLVGFHDSSHMSRAFVRITGRRPGQFRMGFA